MDPIEYKKSFQHLKFTGGGSQETSKSVLLLWKDRLEEVTDAVRVGAGVVVTDLLFVGDGVAATEVVVVVTEAPSPFVICADFVAVSAQLCRSLAELVEGVLCEAYIHTNKEMHASALSPVILPQK